MAPPPSLPRRLAASAFRILIVCIALLALSGGFLAYCVAMPGSSFRGPLPPTSAEERALARELHTHVDALSVKIGMRRAPLGDSLHRAEAYVHDQLSAVAPNAAVTREAFEAQGDPANVIFELPGKVRSPIVIVGAHYDTAPDGTPGANDNATGSAAALVLASRLARAVHRLPIRIVLFANEEPPYYRTSAMGSLRHAQGCRKRGEEIRAMLSLETMGYYSDEPGSQEYPRPLSLFYPDRGNFITFVGNLQSRALVRESIAAFRSHTRFPSEGAALPDALPGIGWSDHWSFWQFGYPAVMVTDTAIFRDPNYHQRSDVIENIDFDRLARVVAGLQKIILGFAN